MQMLHQSHWVHLKCSAGNCTPRGTSDIRESYPYCPFADDAPPAMQWKYRNLPTLIVVLASAISTWDDELKNGQKNLRVWTAYKNYPSPLWNVLQVVPGQEKNTWVPAHKDADLARNVILTSKSSLESRVLTYISVDSHKTKSKKGRVMFGHVIVDESHEVHGMRTAFVDNMRRFAATGARFWFISGTLLPRGPQSMELAFKCWYGKEYCDKSFKLLRKDYDSAIRAMNVTQQYDQGPEMQQQPILASKKELMSKRLIETAAKLTEMMMSNTILQTGSSKFLGHQLLDIPEMHEETVTLDFVHPSWTAKYRNYYMELERRIQAEEEE